jgi:DNA replication and repair protein RecF
LVVQRLWLTDFRSYARAEVELAPGLTVITGANGQGKTNLLEAIGYASTTRSFRGATGEALVAVGAEQAIVRVEGARLGRGFLIEAELRARGRDRLQCNRQRVTRARDLLEVLAVSVFTPDDLVMVKGGPAERRRYLDDLLVSLHPRLDSLRSDVERVLRQKSALLKQARGGSQGDIASTLDVWNQQLAAAGSALGDERARALVALQPLVDEANRQIADRPVAPAVHLAYEAPWREQGLAAALEAARTDELRRGVCLVGPHRDDVVVTLDGLPSRTHASQGEQRTLALALRLGAHRLVAERVGVTPVLLLDDIFSELDPDRSAALLAHLPPARLCSRPPARCRRAPGPTAGWWCATASSRRRPEAARSPGPTSEGVHDRPRRVGGHGDRAAPHDRRSSRPGSRFGRRAARPRPAPPGSPHEPHGGERARAVARGGGGVPGGPHDAPADTGRGARRGRRRPGLGSRAAVDGRRPRGPGARGAG